MAGSREGGLKARDTNKARHGEDFYIEKARMGGSVKVGTKGFGHASINASAAGKLGGIRTQQKLKHELTTRSKLRLNALGRSRDDHGRFAKAVPEAAQMSRVEPVVYCDGSNHPFMKQQAYQRGATIKNRYYMVWGAATGVAMFGIYLATHLYHL